METDKAKTHTTRSKISLYLKGLTPQDKRSLAEALGIKMQQFYKLTKNPGSITMKQLQVILPALQKEHGPGVEREILESSKI